MQSCISKFIQIISLIFCFILNSYGSTFYVSANATDQGDGSFNHPWKLQIALNHPSKLKAGDTIYLRGGIYLNDFNTETSFSCFTKGTENDPIIFRNFNGERSILDGNKTNTLYVAINNSIHTWFWGIEVTNSFSKDRKHAISGGITCTAPNIKFINMIVHDTGGGIDIWKTAIHSEATGCIIYHIGYNQFNNGNWEGHSHGMYLQNDTFGIKKIHQNIIFSTYGYGLKVWQTTATAAIGDFDIRENIIFNGGSASENLGGVGNNYRTHNFFVVSNSIGNPVLRTTIVNNYTFSGSNTPRPPVNAFGLNYGMKDCVIDSNVFTGQLRLGYNNSPIFQANLQGNKIFNGIPDVYGYYLWGFGLNDFPNNQYYEKSESNPSFYTFIQNKYEPLRNHLVIYNWDSLDQFKVFVDKDQWKANDSYLLINVMDCFKDTIKGKIDQDHQIEIPMTGWTMAKAVGSDKDPVSQFPVFGVFILIRVPDNFTTNIPTFKSLIKIFPNPCNEEIEILSEIPPIEIEIYNSNGYYMKSFMNINAKHKLNLSEFSNGVYWMKFRLKDEIIVKKFIVQKNQ
ncbi:MAG: T9SS type A sorting domain-containing protein [Saprospiraceae bacterium]|nr:T9SS type A sorting domain-containing protein [Saprospiraceae bacterium]